MLSRLRCIDDEKFFISYRLVLFLQTTDASATRTFDPGTRENRYRRSVFVRFALAVFLQNQPMGPKQYRDSVNVLKHVPIRTNASF